MAGASTGELLARIADFLTRGEPVMHVAQRGPSSAFEEVCQRDEYDWLRSSGGDNPCQVAERVMRCCRSAEGYEFEPLEDGRRHYPAPRLSQASRCLCSPQLYSLLSACEYCQEASPFYAPVPWSSWVANCRDHIVTDDQLPSVVTPDVSIPLWAWEAETAGLFNLTQAYLVAQAAAAASGNGIGNGGALSVSGGMSEQSLTGSPLGGSSTTNSAATTSQTSPEQTKATQKVKGAMTVTAVVAVVAAIAVVGIGAMIFLLVRRARERRRQRGSQLSSTDDLPSTTRGESKYSRATMSEKRGSTTSASQVRSSDASSFTSSSFVTNSESSGASESFHFRRSIAPTVQSSDATSMTSRGADTMSLGMSSISLSGTMTEEGSTEDPFSDVYRSTSRSSAGTSGQWSLNATPTQPHRFSQVSAAAPPEMASMETRLNIPAAHLARIRPTSADVASMASSTGAVYGRQHGASEHDDRSFASRRS